MARPIWFAGRSGLLAILVGAAFALAACSGAAITAAPASALAPASAPGPAVSPSSEPSMAAPVASMAALPASPAASSKPSGGRYGSGGASSPSPAAGAPAGNAVTVVDFGFNPDTINVKVGTTVTWTNTGVTHTVTADKGLFDSGTLKAGETFSFTFAKGGAFTYHCAIHSSMRGTVTVSP